jgi:hypothetical protein
MPRELSYEGKMKQGRGKIDLQHPENYKPWILARECFKGEGTRHQVPDLYYKNRTIHLMSGLEKNVYYTLRSNPNVLELFEQYPLLSISRTKELCAQHGIRHPRNPYTGKDVVMTTDFLLITKDNIGEKRWLACAVKYSSDIEDIPINKRTREKLFIEREYWESMGVKWCVITEKDINKTYVNNIVLCRTGFSGLGESTVYDAIKFLIIQKKIDIDMSRPIDLDEIAFKFQNGELIWHGRI